MIKELGLIITFAIAILLGVSSPIQSQNIASAKLKVQKASKGKKVIIEADVLYNIDKKEISIHYIYPEEFIFVSNILGETKIYFPKRNEVMLKYNDVFSADTDILFLFLTQNMSEMGLRKLGFELINSEHKGLYHITQWTPPVEINGIAEVELVFQDYTPIYSSFKSPNKETISKTYYNDYQYLNGYYLPLKITEINYISKADSIVSRKDYSMLQFGSQVRSNLLNFNIPFDAKFIK